METKEFNTAIAALLVRVETWGGRNTQIGEKARMDVASAELNLRRARRAIKASKKRYYLLAAEFWFRCAVVSTVN